MTPVAVSEISPLGALDTAFRLLATGPCQLALDGSSVGHGLPARLVTVGDLTTIMPKLPPRARDGVWAEIVSQARSAGPAWVVAACGLALPGLRSMAARLTRGYRGDAADLDAEVLAGFVAALRTASLDRPAIVLRLCWAAYRAGAKARYAEDVHAVARVDSGTWIGAIAPPRPFGHPDLVLVDAVAKEVVTADEAELIGRSRLEGRTLKSAAEELGIPYRSAKRMRANAEPKLADAIIQGEVQTIMAPSEG